MNEEDMQIMPPAVVLAFRYEDKLICSIPTFLLVALIKEENASTTNTGLLDELEIAPDNIAKNEGISPPNEHLEHIQTIVPWKKLEQYMSCPEWIHNALEVAWTNSEQNNLPISIDFRMIEFPEKIYRYMKFDIKRMTTLLKKGELFMPCPAMFNDPFDCSLDDPMRLAFIEAAVGCFSADPDNVLMFSHYSDNHKGLCVGFDTRRLVNSLTTKNTSLRADIRPICYFSSMPPLNLVTQPALCATCKHDIWNYEKEYRIFLARGRSLEPSDSFAFEREAITDIIYGCKVLDETIAECKKLTKDLSTCDHLRANRRLGRFGLQLQKIHKL